MGRSNEQRDIDAVCAPEWSVGYLRNATPGMYLNLTPESQLSSVGIQIAREKESWTMRQKNKGKEPPLPFPPLVSVLMVGLSYGARNVLSYTRHIRQNFLAFRDSLIKTLAS